MSYKLLNSAAFIKLDIDIFAILSVLIEASGQPYQQMGCELSRLQLYRKSSRRRSVIVEVARIFPDANQSDSHKSSISLDISFKRTISKDRDSSEQNCSITQKGYLKRSSCTRRRTVEDLEAIVANKSCLQDFFSEFEKDVLLSTWAVLGQESFRHGLLIFTLASEMFPGLKEIFDVE